MDAGEGREQERKLRLLCKQSLHSKTQENFSSIIYYCIRKNHCSSFVFFVCSVVHQFIS